MTGFSKISGALGQGLALLNKISGMIHDEKMRRAGRDEQTAADQGKVLSNVQKAKDARSSVVSDSSEFERVRDKFTRRK